MPLNHDAIARTLALRLADDTTWDSPPQLYWLVADTDDVRLDLTSEYSDAIATLAGRGVAMAPALNRIATVITEAITTDASLPIAPAGTIGTALRYKGWAVSSEVAAADQLAAAGGNLADHPDAVEVVTVHAVTVDQELHWYQWARGAAAPEQIRANLAVDPDHGAIPRVLRRFAHALNRRQAA